MLTWLNTLMITNMYSRKKDIKKNIHQYLNTNIEFIRIQNF
jgi:hypothetical protein